MYLNNGLKELLHLIMCSLTFPTKTREYSENYNGPRGQSPKDLGTPDKFTTGDAFLRNGKSVFNLLNPLPP